MVDATVFASLENSKQIYNDETVLTYVSYSKEKIFNKFNFDKVTIFTILLASK